MSLYGGRGNGGRSTADKVSYRDYNGISRRDNSSSGCSIKSHSSALQIGTPNFITVDETQLYAS